MTIFCHNIAKDVSDKSFRDLISSYGQVVKITKPDQDCAKYCFVDYETEEEEKKAIDSLHHMRINGVLLGAEPAKRAFISSHAHFHNFHGRKQKKIPKSSSKGINFLTKPTESQYYQHESCIQPRSSDSPPDHFPMSHSLAISATSQYHSPSKSSLPLPPQSSCPYPNQFPSSCPHSSAHPPHRSFHSPHGYPLPLYSGATTSKHIPYAHPSQDLYHPQSHVLSYSPKHQPLVHTQTIHTSSISPLHHAMEVSMCPEDVTVKRSSISGSSMHLSATHPSQTHLSSYPERYPIDSHHTYPVHGRTIYPDGYAHSSTSTIVSNPHYCPNGHVPHSPKSNPRPISLHHPSSFSGHIERRFSSPSEQPILPHGMKIHGSSIASQTSLPKQPLIPDDSLPTGTKRMSPHDMSSHLSFPMHSHTAHVTRGSFSSSSDMDFSAKSSPRAGSYSIPCPSEQMIPHDGYGRTVGISSHHQNRKVSPSNPPEMLSSVQEPHGQPSFVFPQPISSQHLYDPSMTFHGYQHHYDIHSNSITPAREDTAPLSCHISSRGYDGHVGMPGAYPNSSRQPVCTSTASISSTSSTSSRDDLSMGEDQLSLVIGSDRRRLSSSSDEPMIKGC
ncbi:hypothetical protein ADUPG1_012982 [Aduncisulcus paluster]|uniref:RRM domain-containing protein n=1 Tax=Aduncisulcus paluster TaxID=2918883 RepID=A0ABQ5K1Y3_9EUKA|nr:hypothetical protein ADUPG1_012982 [Aduncisulcus paluster]|eukprot:gnl/Carplike_NY0171/1470_a1999_1124.p1 GENE.gnl/Carplike_NY0171/1470_a1999_1124~~gnl/Carplike_NY0171/1470_a1999_1124.p1  ORF type:complete len:614 (+),score=97.70 gnl/Carplike_NY0171/1470_a1999_1124:100-1941(+)